jgi:DNA-binding Xre family transcriptional regulator
MIICTLKELLERKGWSRYRLQKESQISSPTIHALYHGKSQLYSARVLDKLCRTLGCRLDEILKFEPKRFPRLCK